MIDRQTVDRIIDAANIYDVVSDYVTLRRTGASYKGLCPFHDDKTPSFYVNPAKGVCKCFSCGKGGSAVGFIMEIEQMSYPEALRHLAKKFNIEIKEEELTKEEQKNRNERERMLALNDWAASFYHDYMLHDPMGQAVGMAYFRSRGFRDDIIEKFKLGYAPDQWDALAKAALAKGFKEDILVATSLAFKKDNGTLTDKFRGRAMFPWFSLSGQVIGFGGRVLDARTKGVAQKYVNSSDSEVYHKLQELYGLFQAKKQIAKDQLVYMVEGYTDVLSMHQCGIENVVANSGTALNDAQIRLLKRFTNNIILIYDGDEAGIHAAIRGTDMLLAQNMNVKVLILPDGHDPDSYSRQHSAQEFKDYVRDHQTDFIIFKVNLLMRDAGTDPRKRSEVTENILNSISVIPDEIVRSAYLHECAELMNMDEQMLMRRCVQLRKINSERKLKEQEQERARQQRLQEREQQQNVDPEAGGQQSPAPQTQTDSPEPSATADQNPGLQQQQSPAQPSQPQVSSSEPPQFQAVSDKWTADMVGLEALIMQMVVRYGEQLITTEDENGQQVPVKMVRWVKEQLDVDNMAFISPLYAAMMDEALRLVDNEGETCSRIFLSSPDLQVQHTASEMLNEKYRVDSTYYTGEESDNLAEIIQRLVLDYKYYFVRREIHTMKLQLADKAVMSDSSKYMEILKRYMFFTEIQKQLAKNLGEKIISV